MPIPWRVAALLGLSSLAFGASGPIYDSYMPFFLGELLAGDAAVGAVMGIDNVVPLLVVPLVGALSDRVRTKLGRRVPFVLAALPIVAMAFATLPLLRASLPAMIAGIVVLALASSTLRAPMQALLADLVPSSSRSQVAGVMSVFMCLGAMPMIAASSRLHAKDPALPFLLVGSVVAIVAIVYAFKLREPPVASEPRSPAESSPFAALAEVWRQAEPTTARFFAACMLFHMAFQSFSTWFTRHAAERFAIEPSQASLGFIVVGVANLAASIPGGFLGARFGRRRVAVIATLLMALACIAAHFASTFGSTVAILALFGAAWATALVNLMPMALELGGLRRAATFAAIFLFCQYVAGMLGPLLCGAAFDAAGDRRLLFALLAAFLVVSAALAASLRRGLGETRDEGVRVGADGA
jgi:maltose/moltooligosaccharide transporter